MLSKLHSFVAQLPELALEYRERTGRPLVTLSYAQSLDGSLAVRRGVPLALSSPASLKFTHRLRAAHDAILVGIGTVLADDPRLTVRKTAGNDPQPLVLDSRLQFPRVAKMMGNPVLPWIVTTGTGCAEQKTALEAAGARVLALPASPEGNVHLSALLDWLGECGIASVMVEGGATVVTNFLRQRLVNWAIITIAPVYVGGLNAVETLLVNSDWPASENPKALESRFPRLREAQYQQLGPDLLVWGEVA